MSKAIKKGLECCTKTGEICATKGCPCWEARKNCIGEMCQDALAYIETLEARLEEAKKGGDPDAV